LVGVLVAVEDCAAGWATGTELEVGALDALAEAEPELPELTVLVGGPEPLELGAGVA
jgi:hypothetical protein